MVRLISVPYHLGRHGVGMGAGPDRLLTAGAVRRLTSLGLEVNLDEVTLPVPFDHEIGAHFALQQVLAEHVAKAVASADFSVVLAGNCSSVVGVVAGLGLDDRTGVVWFDAHADANTPETTDSGFLNGMPVAILTGTCWTGLASSIPGFTPLPDTHVILAGVRSIDDNERKLLASSEIGLVSAAELENAEQFGTGMSELSARVESIHVHIDLDVIDLSNGRANEFAAPGGPTLAALDAAFEEIGNRCAINRVSLTSYNPSVDKDERALDAAMHLLITLAEQLC